MKNENNKEQLNTIRIETGEAKMGLIFHNLIFEVVMLEDGFDFNVEKHLVEDALYDYFSDGFGRFFSYVYEEEEECEHYIEEFKNKFSFLFINDELVLNDEVKKEYFETRFKKFKKYTNALTLDEFCQNSMMLFLRDFLENENDIYIVISCADGGIEGIYTLDYFIREYEGKFAIVNTMSYYY